MKKIPPISSWKNGLCRKIGVICALCLFPFILFASVARMIFMEGVPETWDSLKGFIRLRSEISDAIKEAWIGTPAYRLKNRG